MHSGLCKFSPLETHKNAKKKHWFPSFGTLRCGAGLKLQKVRSALIFDIKFSLQLVIEAKTILKKYKFIQLAAHLENGKKEHWTKRISSTFFG